MITKPHPISSRSPHAPYQRYQHVEPCPPYPPYRPRGRRSRRRAGRRSAGRARVRRVPGGVPASASARATTGPDTEALSAALAGLPDHDITAALIRVGGHGSWRGTAGVRDVRTGRRPWRTRGSGPVR
ncbi:hypothetical protein ACFQ3Z_32795 [Streptomyces nogalater]